MLIVIARWINAQNAEYDGDTTKCSQAILSVGTILNISGAVLNAEHLRWAFLIWMASNLLCGSYFLGAWRGWWRVEKSEDWKLAGMYLVFLITSVVGWTH